jgi:OCT family organic cation transporter-like MFS transporter 4/5
MSHVRLLDASSDEDDEESHPPDNPEDIVTETIGSFGPYQLWLCLLGFLLNVVHCWLSLSLKFVGLVPSFVCGEGDSVGNSTCEMLMGNMTKPCTSFIFSKEEVEDTIVERWGLVCDKGGLENVAQSVFFTGCLVGVFLAGLMADMMGRKVVCVVLATTFLVSGVLGGLVTSWYVWLMLRFVVGAASIGMVTVRYIIQVEMIGGMWRSWANTFTSTGWVVGYMTLPILAYTIPNMRQMEVFIGLSSLPLLLLLVFCHPESPRWLLARGKVTKAVTILNTVASWNKRRKIITEEQVNKFITSQSKARVISSKPTTDSLFSVLTTPYPTTRTNLFIMSFCWFAFGMAYFGLALHTPELGSNVFIVFFIGGLMDVPVILVGPVLLNHAGRKHCMV